MRRFEYHSRDFRRKPGKALRRRGVTWQLYLSRTTLAATWRTTSRWGARTGCRKTIYYSTFLPLVGFSYSSGSEANGSPPALHVTDRQELKHTYPKKEKGGKLY